MEYVRFLIVAILGLGLDIGASWILAHSFGVILWQAAGIGFVFAAVFNYMLHELWTFRDGARELSAVRSVRYLAVLVMTFFTRLAVVAGLDVIFPALPAIIVLLFGAGVSFLVSFAASKRWVFRTIKAWESQR
ncbi:GtrA family protein [Primorskyibacter aestuariivivens]|uniref:GtrA family protein n=1 Tax=Primorskyibacter aestuariivivens TaxID=1888912 RepID=UPI0023010530|nr:GtrA family protein [Primorskyibacter aestuariivivens]MDA7430280.1 GtrA family protein [Primorskyibacter aestuariivivens]